MPRITVDVGEDVAELTGLFARTRPYPHKEERIRFGAVLRGSSHRERLRFEFWAETPSGELIELSSE